MSTPSAQFEWFEFEGVLCLIDLNGSRSLTNDMENALEKLRGFGISTERPIVYRDSEGIWDEVVTYRGRFQAFDCLNSKNHREAIHKMRARDRALKAIA
jgi:hypothetical protein